jgi:hypothetical protein
MEERGLTYDLDTCHRLALDHVLGLIAGADWSDQLILRGSMLMTAYAGSAARKPGDLDFVVIEDGWPVDERDPYPYVDELSTVQQWPEAAAGAAGDELWVDQEFDTGGQKPRVSPDGLNWVMTADWEHSSPYGDLLSLMREHPEAGGGVVLEPDRFEESGDWDYSGYAETTGVRLTVPWHTEGEQSSRYEGVVQLDFAMDETVPQRPVWVRIPRLAGGHSVVRAADPQLSLAWKLLWLLQDTEENGESRGKDLYDAVLLAELPTFSLDERLLRMVLRRRGLEVRDLQLRHLDDLTIDWDAFTAHCPQATGTLGDWLGRLGSALALT